MGNRRNPEGKDRGKAPVNNDSDSDEAVAPSVRAPNKEELKNTRGLCSEVYGSMCRTTDNKGSSIKPKLKDGHCFGKQDKFMTLKFCDTVLGTRGYDWLSHDWVKDWLYKHCKHKASLRRPRNILKTNKKTGVQSIYHRKASIFSGDGSCARSLFVTNDSSDRIIMSFCNVRE
jgi:hypothetical protein